MQQGSISTVFSPKQRHAGSSEVAVAAIQRAGMLDWPGRVSATAFIAGCNLRCPYCHNPELIGVPRRLEGQDSLLELVRERRNWLDGVVITGGEPCRDAELPDLLRQLGREGMPVKLDTNGTMPEVLEQILAEGLVSFVALDVKATPERYERATGIREVWPLVSRSVSAIISSGVDHEFRTTCYPLAVGPNDLPIIAKTLRGGRRYVLQQFRPMKTLDPAAVTVRPHTSDTLCKAAERCSAHLPTAVRGV